MRSAFIALGVLLTEIIAQVAPPVGWGDFQMGIVNTRRTEWDTPMRAAMNDGVQIDRRYIYITEPSEVKGSNAFIFPEGWGTNYSTDPEFIDKGIRPTLTVYMLQKGADGLDAVVNGCADQTHMASYFDALIHTVEKSKGVKPIYVIEPDVWGYLIQNNEADSAKTNLAKTCHINNLGYAHLDEFSNTIKDLPKAIIKTIKMYDPDSYAGILMAHWGYGLYHLGINDPVINMSPANYQLAAKNAAVILDTLLGFTYRGDFMGVEKNGADAGWYLTAKGASKSDASNSRYWTDANNANWLGWTKALSQELNLPIVGWQICLGHEGLPNTSLKYEDTFFEYFYDHVPDFIDAGFIGIMAGCNNMGIGTVAEYNSTNGDGGWFYDQLKVFNQGRPYLSDTPQSLHSQLSTQTKQFQFHRESLSLELYTSQLASPVQLVSLEGRVLQRYYAGGLHSLAHLPQGSYYLIQGQQSQLVMITK